MVVASELALAFSAAAPEDEVGLFFSAVF